MGLVAGLSMSGVGRGEYEAIRFEVRDSVAQIVLNRPEAGNALTEQMMLELADVTVRLATDADVRVVVLRGSGKNFCYGVDLGTFSDTPGDRRSALVREHVTVLHQAITRLARLELPVLGVMQGTTVGGGLAMLAACDVVVASDTSRFRMGWGAIGLTMDCGSSWLLPRILGARRTLELLYTNRIFTAAEAHEWGLVNWVTPDDDLDARVDELIEMLANGATRALGGSKRLIIEGATQSFETQLEDEAVAISHSVGAGEHEEGLRAFLERRPADFRTCG
jgi:2-(1,2-epoxy-1,2-dihydrophenyl)acetyl-CoA isomerase